MDQETLFKLASNLFLIFGALPIFVQAIFGFIFVMVLGTISFRIFVFWQRLKALRYGRVHW